MPRGRRPKPTNVKRLEGNRGHRPQNTAEPKPDDAKPDRPQGLTAEARQAWDRLAPPLHRCGLLTTIDADGLESYCRLYAHARECWRKAKKDGPLVIVGGKVETNPYIREAHRCEDLLHKLRSELGLNATSRSRIQVTPSEKPEDLDNFLKFPGGAA